MPDTLETAQRFIFVTQVHFCAMYAVVVWDWITSLHTEWRCIWNARWTPIKCSYIMCRYWVLVVVPYLLYVFCVDHDLDRCKSMYRTPVILAMWNQVGAEAVLIIRTYAFFNCNKFLLAGLLVSMSGLISYQLWVAVTEMDLLPFVNAPFTSGPCFPVSKPHSAQLLGFFIAPLVFDTVMTCMTVGKALSLRRRNGGTSSKVIETFIREGVFYFLLIAVANLINGIFYLQPRQVISAICIPLSVMLAPLLACRMILDLRSRALARGSTDAEGAYDTADLSATANSPIKFTSGLGFGLRSKQSNLVRSGRGVTTTFNSGIISVHGVELDGMEGRTVTVEGDSEVYEYRSVELGKPGAAGMGVEGIRVDVEKTTM